MDRITKSYVEAFRTEQSLPAGDEAATFEHFVNFCVMSDAFDDEFDITDVHAGGGDDLTLDGIAILVNGQLVTASDEAQALLDTNGFLDVQFHFMQAKTSSGFSGEQIGSFGTGVGEFFAEEPVLPISDKVQEFRELMTWIYDHSVAFKHGRPTCDLVMVTTGSWQKDKHLVGKMTIAEQALSASNLFDRVTFKGLGAAEIQASWNRTKNAASVEFTFSNKVTLPDIDGVSESYLGILPLSEFLNIVGDPDSGNIRKNIFYDNVRDYQGDNAVNSEMTRSLQTLEGRERFAVLNNGVTVVARTMRNTGNKFLVSDYQIVNGCQTSHVLYNNRADLSASLSVPLKVVASNDEEVINSIITATNRQTQVSDEDLFALSTFQKTLESYLGAFDEKHRLHYERRSKQYISAGVEKVRIMTKTLEMRAFAAMFLDDARRAANYYSELKTAVGKTIFNADHKMDPYYAAAYGYYKLEFAFRNGLIPVSYKPARFHLLMAFRHIVGGAGMPALTANQMVKYTKPVIEALWSDTHSIETFTEACSAIDKALDGQELTRDSAKGQAFSDSVLAALG